MKKYYSIVYATAGLNLSCGILATFTTLYAANKYKEKADLALKNSGLYGVVTLQEYTGDLLVEDLDKFFEEY